MTVRYEDVRDVGFFLFASGGFVTYFTNGSLMLILGADILIAGCERRSDSRCGRRRRLGGSGAVVEGNL